MNTAVTCQTVSTREAAAQIGISYDKCLDLIKERQLRARWLGNKYRVPLTAIQEFLNATES